MRLNSDCRNQNSGVSFAVLLWFDVRRMTAARRAANDLQLVLVSAVTRVGGLTEPAEKRVGTIVVEVGVIEPRVVSDLGLDLYRGHATHVAQAEFELITSFTALQISGPLQLR